MYACTSFRGGGRAKLEKRKGVFLAMVINLMAENKEKNMQKHIFRGYFHAWRICKGCVLKALL